MIIKHKFTHETRRLDRPDATHGAPPGIRESRVYRGQASRDRDGVAAIRAAAGAGRAGVPVAVRCGRQSSAAQQLPQVTGLPLSLMIVQDPCSITPGVVAEIVRFYPACRILPLECLRWVEHV
jgi:hypothetical protein